MKLSSLIIAVILMVLSLLLADYLLKPDFDDDTPISLDIISEREVAEDFEKYVQQLPADKRRVLVDYLIRVDDGELRQGDSDYNLQDVTPAEVFKANQAELSLANP